MRLLDYFFSFVSALYEQLLLDQERWGNEWKRRPIEAGPVDPSIDKNTAQKYWAHQNDRVYNRIKQYYDDWETGETPYIPWLKICGNAFIAWVREQDPEGYKYE